MRAVKSFPPIDETEEKEPLAFDFYPSLRNGVTLTGTPTVEISVVEGADPDPTSRLVGQPTVGTVDPPDGDGIANTAIIQMVGNCIGGVTYLLHAFCDKSDGGTASLWAHLVCVTPG